MHILPVQLVKRRLKQDAITFFHKVYYRLTRYEDCRLHPIYAERWIGFTLRLIKPYPAVEPEKGESLLARVGRARRKDFFS
jgi:hypothetical protein